MHQQGHAGLRLVHAQPQPFQESVFIVEAGEDFLDRTEYAAFFRLGGIAMTRTGGVVVKVVRQATTKAVVEPRAGETLAVFKIGRTAETDFAVGIKAGQRPQDSLLLGRSQLRRLSKQPAYGGQLHPHGGDIGRILKTFQARLNGGRQGSTVGQRLVQELVP
ncbi:MAG: hypothetical protein BWX84_03252 [Verrucomicrobia bacterium ADurb.Bin118]|nr:MAG: hypothetical protein BWX84_03252 [Verrucomicrobia bacterium ADurb.Bin118]